MKGQHKIHNNQNVNMHIIVTLIGNLSFDWETVSSKLFIKMSNFHRQIFQNKQQLELTPKIYGSSFFVGTIIGA